MSNFKRKSPKTKVRCAGCTPFREGNAKNSTKPKYRLDKQELAVKL